jgi:bacteriocin-like protein
MSEELSDNDLDNVSGGAGKAKLFVRKQGTESNEY